METTVKKASICATSFVRNLDGTYMVCAHLKDPINGSDIHCNTYPDRIEAIKFYKELTKQSLCDEVETFTGSTKNL